MVGFGSSLRMARRSGWEDAYIDYESLKLLLTQIEAVYEEEAQLQRQQNFDPNDVKLRDLDVMFVETPDRKGKRDQRQQQQQQQQPGDEKLRDYRDELFLESDSDKALEILMKYDKYSEEEQASDMEQQRQQILFEQQWAGTMQSMQQSPSNVLSGEREAAVRNSNVYDRHPQQQQQLQLQKLNSHAGKPRKNRATFGNFSSVEEYSHLDGRIRYDSDDSQDDEDGHNTCVPSFGRSKTKNTKTSKGSSQIEKKNLRPNFRATSNSHGSYLSSSRKSDKWFVAANTDSRDNLLEESNDYTQLDMDGMASFASFGRPDAYNNDDDDNNIVCENTSLLPATSTTPGNKSLYSFAAPTGLVTPPAVHVSHVSNAKNPSRPASIPKPKLDNNSESNNNKSSVSLPTTAPTITHHSNKSQLLKQLEEERKVERRKRRQKKRQRAEKRKALERKVPRHIRRAHTQAREITERFLGLLRAECEKVMLFAESRLGELADTAGSLRFPAVEDHHQRRDGAGSEGGAGSSQHQIHRRVESFDVAPLSPTGSGSYEYPLSDTGIHPSASSSSDDGVRENGLFYWSDSSNDSTDSEGNGSPNIATSLSTFRESQYAQHKHSTSNASEVDDQRHRRVSSSSSRKHDGYASTKRHLDHFEKIRRQNPTFQRNGNIMGEDLLLLSAVDEADGYTAVGVELMHVLRYIAVNLIAVRKICRKHDRLLMNRMLGFYYPLLKLAASGRTEDAKNAHSYQDEHIQNAQTLGGLLASESGDIFETHHPAVIAKVNNYKLVGLYDANLQQLTNSRTVQVISSCLVLALSEYEVSRSRAKALADFNTHGGKGAQSGSRQTIFRSQQQFLDQQTSAAMAPLTENDESGGLDSDGEGGPPSTASGISLTRLRFTVTSIIALREASRRKNQMYLTYLSRSMLAFTGRAIVGDGLDGCSRETLDFFRRYNPDAALLMDPSLLDDGLRQGMWSKLPFSSVFASSLAVAATPINLPETFAIKSLHRQEKFVRKAVNLFPKLNFFDVPELFTGRRAKKSVVDLAILENDRFRSILLINRGSHLLYTINYYIVHPTTITFTSAISSPGAHSALVIGAPSVAAIIAAIFHCYVLSGDSRAPMAKLSSLRWLFSVAAFFGVAGNAVHVYGIWENSIAYAILGRFIMGFSCSEILHRNIVAGFLPVHRVVTETAILVQVQVLGMLLGLGIGTVADYLSLYVVDRGIRSLSSSSWLMSLFWFVHFLHASIGFKIEEDGETKRREAKNSAEVEQLLTKSTAQKVLNHECDSSWSLQGRRNDSAHDLRLSLHSAYGAEGETQPVRGGDTDCRLPPKPIKETTKKRVKSRLRRMRTLKSYPARLRSLLNYSVAVPICLLITFFIKFALEVLLSSCPMIVDRYFQWGGGRAGLFLACLALTVLPVNFICCHNARKHDERTVMKNSISVLVLGLLVMINYSSFVELAFQLEDLFEETKEEEQAGSQSYDWFVGRIQYFVGFFITFLGLTSLDGAALSLLSKASPPRLRTSSAALQLGTIVSFVSLFARVIADAQIFMIGLSHRLINTDLVNSLLLPILVACFVIGHFIRKHYFFMI